MVDGADNITNVRRVARYRQQLSVRKESGTPPHLYVIWLYKEEVSPYYNRVYP